MAAAPAEAASRVVWVNAGPAGLSVAACLWARGLPSVVLDRADYIASLWQRRTYDRLRRHLPRFCELKGMPLIASYPAYPTKEQFLDYLEYLNAYAARAGPRFNQVVTSARYAAAAGLWRVHANDTEDAAAGATEWRWLVVATGENAERIVPEFEGAGDFKGPVSHVSEYKSGEAFRGKRVLVVGCGNSGMEVCLDLCDHNALPSMVVRDAVHVLPREMFGVATFVATKPIMYALLGVCYRPDDLGTGKCIQGDMAAISTSVVSSSPRSSRGSKWWAGALTRCFGGAGDEKVPRDGSVHHSSDAIPASTQPADLLLPPNEWDCLPIMWPSIVNRDGSCVICASLVCIEAHYRRLHGTSSFSFLLTEEAIEKIKRKCEVVGAWKRVRGADTVQGVLDVLRSWEDPGIATVDNGIFLRLKGYESFQAKMMSNSRMKYLIHDKGPLVGVLYSCTIYQHRDRSSRERHAVACVGYRCVGEDLSIIIVDNATCDGPILSVPFDAFLEFHALKVDA